MPPRKLGVALVFPFLPSDYDRSKRRSQVVWCGFLLVSCWFLFNFVESLVLEATVLYLENKRRKTM